MTDLLTQNATPTELHVKAFLADKQREGMSSRTIANYVKAFRSFFKYLDENRVYDFDTERLKQPRIKYKERGVPKENNIERLVRFATDAEDTIASLLLIDCGVRITELVTIKLRDIDFDESSIAIYGKGGKQRTAYLSDQIIARLRSYVGSLKSEFLFPSSRADTRIPHRERRYFERRLKELYKRAGVERLTPHQLRHYFATHALSHGTDVKAVNEFLGHANVTITLKIYHHVDARAITRIHREHSQLAGFMV